MKNEIACGSFENAFVLAKTLLEENYVVMLSREENLWIINYLWSEHNANRNDVKFFSNEEFEDILSNY